MLLSANIEKLSSDTAVVTFSGPLTLGTSLMMVDTQVQQAIEDGVIRMVFDFSEVDFLDSAGLGMVVCTYGALSQKNGDFRLCCVRPRIRSLLNVTKTSSFLHIDSRRTDSINAMD